MKVARYANFTVGFNVETDNTIRYEPLDGKPAQTSNTVRAGAQVRVREEEAYHFGMPVDHSGALRAERLAQQVHDIRLANIVAKTLAEPDGIQITELARQLGLTVDQLDLLRRDVALLGRGEYGEETDIDRVETAYRHPRFAGLVSVWIEGDRVPANTDRVRAMAESGLTPLKVAELTLPLRSPPPLAAAGRAIGMATVDKVTGADDMLNRIYPDLANAGFLPRKDAAGRYMGDVRRLVRQFDNLSKLKATLSRSGVTAQFEPAMQHGIPILLTDASGRVIEVLVRINLFVDEGADGVPKTRWRQIGRSHAHHVVNLWISSDSSSGSRGMTNTQQGSITAGMLLGLKDRANLSLPVYSGKKSFRQGNTVGSGTTVNNVELLESHDPATEFEFSFTYKVTARFPDKATPLFDIESTPQTASIWFIEDVASTELLDLTTGDGPAADDSADDSLDRLYKEVGYVVSDTIDVRALLGKLEQVLPPQLTQRGTRASGMVRAFGIWRTSARTSRR